MNSDIEFLINCCKRCPTEAEREAIKNHIAQQHGERLSNLITLAHMHGVYPLFYRAIEQYTTEYLSGTEQETVKKANLSIVMQNMGMTAELFRVSDTLSKNAIETLPFKGPTLAQIAYRDTTLRQYNDLDIWVDRCDVYGAAELIVDMGYQPMDSISFLKNELKLDTEKNYEFYKESNGTKLELHWRLTSSYFARGFESYDYQNNTSLITINSSKIRTLDNGILLIYLCLHGASHMWERLEWIADIDRLVTENSDSIDWKETIDLSSNLHCKKPLLLGLGLAMDIFGTTVPHGIAKQITGNSNSAKQVDKIRTLLGSDLIHEDHDSKTKNLSIFMFQLSLLETLYDKVGFVTNSLFGISDRDVMVINLPRPLSFLYYPIRIARIFSKYTIEPIRSFIFRSRILKEKSEP